jgi:uroporphyrinogen-III synthase
MNWAPVCGPTARPTSLSSGGAPRLSRNEVLITRPSAEGDRTADRLRALAFQPVAAPLLRIRPLPLRPPGQADAVLVTSRNALPALHGVTHLPLLAVGDATAERAQAAGFLRVASAGGDAEDLLRLTQSLHRPGASLLLATGRRQGSALAQGLRDAGFRLHRRVVYAAAPERRLPEAAIDSLASGRTHAVLFMSAETARVFVALLPPDLRPALAGVEALAIGRNAADILAPLPWRRVRVSVEPTLEQVLALL